MRLTLTPHPTSGPTPLQAVTATVEHRAGPLEMRSAAGGAVEVRRKGGRLIVTYALTGDLARLNIPESRTPERAEGLWRTTCLEAFIRALDGTAYYEFNFSPSGRWAAYRFDSERRGMVDLEDYDPVTRFERTADGARLIAEIPLPADAVGPIGLSAVIEEADGGPTTFWGLAHPSPKPDFHAPGAFALTLEPA